MTTVDLRKDAAIFREMLSRCSSRYSVAHTSLSGRKFHPPVTRIDFVYTLGDGESMPFVVLNLDSKPSGEPDGAPTHPWFDIVDCLEWGFTYRFLVENEKRRDPIVLPDGRLSQSDARLFEQLIPELLVQVLKDARDHGVFSELPHAARCEMSVEEYGGGFAWPIYGDRGKENLVSPVQPHKLQT